MRLARPIGASKARPIGNTFPTPPTHCAAAMREENREALAKALAGSDEGPVADPKGHWLLGHRRSFHDNPVDFAKKHLGGGLEKTISQKLRESKGS